MSQVARLPRLGGMGVVAILAATLALFAAAIVATPAAAQTPTTFTVTITNQTNPEMVITPGAYLVHTEADAFWSSGGTANVGLERIAEIGDPTEAIAALGGTMIDAAPADGDSVTFEITASPGDLFSFAQMLMSSNDGFVGVNSEPLFDGDTPRSISLDLVGWDAGTEENADLFGGFDVGQPDPAQGAANVDNGTATSDPIAEHEQFTGTQATLTIEPMADDSGAGAGTDDGAGAGTDDGSGDDGAAGAGAGGEVTPPAAGNAGLIGDAGAGGAWQLMVGLAAAAVTIGAAVASRRAVGERRC